MQLLKDVLIDRDGISEAEALELIAEARQAVIDGEDPEEVLLDMFGLEPDYFWDILP